MQTERFEESIAYHCAPALVGLRPACLVSLSVQEYPDVLKHVGRYNRQLGGRGLRFDVLCRCGRRFLLLVYRPEHLERCLTRRPVAALLERVGYPAQSPLLELLRHLRRRLLAEEGFPHEIGLFLGYPPEDVQGFLSDPGGAHCKLCGHWKVYHDVERARRQFQRFDRCRDILCARLRAGKTLAELFGAAGPLAA